MELIIKSPQNNSTLFLPNFCSFKVFFSVLIIGELLAFILTLAPLQVEQQRWNELALISLFIQWNGLICSATLCLIRSWVKNYSNIFVASISYLSILLIITLISESTFFLIEYMKIEDVIAYSTHWEFLRHNLFLGGIIGAIALHYLYIQHQWRIKVQAESNTNLKLLQARIRPHFLFNSLNSIASLTRTRPKVAERITEDLAELFRMLIREDHQLIAWKREHELSLRYIDIEQQRLGERLKFTWLVNEIPEDATIPALLIQPLLENAIFHGIEPQIDGGFINVRSVQKQQLLIIDIENSQANNHLESNHRSGNKMALENIKQRLHAHFHGSASINIHQTKNHYKVHITLPYIKQSSTY